MVGLRLSLGADLCCDLAADLLVDCLNDDGVGIRNVEGVLCCLFEEDGVRVTKLELKLLAVLGYSVSYTYDLELLCVALGYTDHHIVDECTGETVECAVILIVVGTSYGNGCALYCDSHLGGGCVNKSALSALNSYKIVCVHVDCYTSGNSDGISSDS